MKEVTLYDVLGVLAPGTVITAGIIVLYPQTRAVLTQKEFTIGDFGLVVLISYVAGNLVAALGHLFETFWWKIRGGSPTDRARSENGAVLSPREQKAVQEKLRTLAIIAPSENISSLANSDWRSIARRIYTFVEARGMTRRIDLFNAQYGMNRGIAAALLMLVVMIALHCGFSVWKLELILVGCALLALYRMGRFSRYYATELFRQFLIAPSAVPPEPKEK
jgi:hypothetical protein